MMCDPPAPNNFHWTGMQESDADKRLNLEHVLLNGTCPDCRVGHFIEGPRGGASINVKCDNTSCRSEFNLMLPIMVERIDRDDYRWYMGSTLIFEGLPKGGRARWKRWWLRRALDKRDLRKAKIALTQ